MQLFPKIPPAPTMILNLADLRAPNEFDRVLLAQEGVRQGSVTIRGASIAPEKKPEPALEKPCEPQCLEPTVVVERLPPLLSPPEEEGEAPTDARILYASILSIGVCVAASLGVLLAAVS